MSEGESGRRACAERSLINAAPPGAGGFRRIPSVALWCVVGGLLAAAVFAVYGRSLHAPFVFDDAASVLDNPSIKTLFPLLGGAPGSTPLDPPPNIPPSGRPLVNLSLALNYALGGLEPFGYHLFNVVVHILVATLLWAFVGGTLRLPHFQGRFDRAAEPLAFFVALVWALHPLVTEAVEYVSQRTELMIGFFYMATMYASLRYFTTQKPRRQTTWCALAIAACWLGMACKEVMVTAPVMVLLYDRTFFARSCRGALQGSWRLYLGLASSWLLVLALSYSAPHSAVAGFREDVVFYAWWLTQAKVLEMYLKLAFWPWPLVIHYEFPIVVNPSGVWPSLLVAGILAINVVLRLWQRRATGFLGAWLFLILSVTLVVPTFPEIAAERRMYLPLAAIVVVVVVGGYALLQWALASAKRPAKESDPWPLAMTAAGALIVAGVFALVSARRLTAYDSNLALWQDAITWQPDNFVVQSGLAAALLLAGREEEANAYFERALPTNPAGTHRLWGVALTRAAKPQQAIEHLEIAVRLAPGSAECRRGLGAALVAAGRPEDAIPHLKQALKLEPNSADVRLVLDQLTGNIRRTKEIQRLRRALENQPGSAQLHYDLGLMLYAGNQMDEATVEFQRALELQPDFPAAKRKLEQARKR